MHEFQIHRLAGGRMRQRCHRFTNDGSDLRLKLSHAMVFAVSGDSDIIGQCLNKQIYTC